MLVPDEGREVVIGALFRVSRAGLWGYSGSGGGRRPPSWAREKGDHGRGAHPVRQASIAISVETNACFTRTTVQRLRSSGACSAAARQACGGHPVSLNASARVADARLQACAPTPARVDERRCWGWLCSGREARRKFQGEVL